MTCTTTTTKPQEPPHLPELRRLFVVSLTGRTADPEALADDLESAWLLPVWKQWQIGAGKHFPKGLKVRGPRERRDDLKRVADQLRAVLPELCDAYSDSLATLAPETPKGASLSARIRVETEEHNRFARGAYAELLRVVATIEEAARVSDERTRTGPPTWCAKPEVQIAQGLRKQLENRGIVCINKAAEPYRCAAVWVWSYLELSGDPMARLRQELRSPARSASPAPSLLAWPCSTTTRRTTRRASA